MAKSNTPLALSVVGLTEPGDVARTLEHITAFDDSSFGFNHNQTWSALPGSLRGVNDPKKVAASFMNTKVPKRVQNCIVALCALGQKRPLKTQKFSDFPNSGLATIQSIDWDPEIRIRVKGSCWYVENGVAHIPLLQPRKMAFDPFRLSIYLELAKQAYCKDDWSEALIDLIDLSGDGPVTARLINTSTLPEISARDLREFIETFVEAKRLADMKRAKRSKALKPIPLFEKVPSG